MLYQLPNGKTINISVEDYLNMSDADIEFLVKANVGNHVNNPWINSVIKNNKEEKVSNDLDYSIEDESELYLKSDKSLEPREESADDLPENLLDI